MCVLDDLLRLRSTYTNKISVNCFIIYFNRIFLVSIVSRALAAFCLIKCNHCDKYIYVNALANLCVCVCYRLSFIDFSYTYR